MSNLKTTSSLKKAKVTVDGFDERSTVEELTDDQKRKKRLMEKLRGKTN